MLGECLEKALEMNASKVLKQYSTLAKQSGKLNISIYSKHLKFQALPKFRQLASLPATLPAVRPGFAMSRPPDFLQVMYSRVRFTNFSITENSSTTPSSFLLTTTGLPYSSLIR